MSKVVTDDCNLAVNDIAGRKWLVHCIRKNKKNHVYKLTVVEN